MFGQAIKQKRGTFWFDRRLRKKKKNPRIGSISLALLRARISHLQNKQGQRQNHRVDEGEESSIEVIKSTQDVLEEALSLSLSLPLFQTRSVSHPSPDYLNRPISMRKNIGNSRVEFSGSNVTIVNLVSFMLSRGTDARKTNSLLLRKS